MLIHDMLLEESDDGAVGIFTQPDGSYQLKVPFGMSGMAPAQALAVLYKSFAVFRRTRRSFKRLGQLDGLEEHSEPGLQEGDGGISFCDAMGLDELFDRADPLGLLSLRKRIAQQPWDVTRHLERHLHLAVFDNNGAPYLERTPGSRREACYGMSDIVGLYCFIADDFYRAFLGIDPACRWGSLSADAQAIAAHFRHRHLAANDSLFGIDRQQCLRTRQHLHYLLREINRQESLRGSNYRLLHEVLERYLYGGHTHGQRQGQIWGIKNFWAVWESVCLHHAATGQGEPGMMGFMTCDFDHLPSTLSTPMLRKHWLATRAQIFHRNGIERRPDLVLNTQTQVKVIDFKYYRHPPTERCAASKNQDVGLTKLEQDFNNIEVYGLLTHNHLLRDAEQRHKEIALEFWLPGREAEHTPVVHAPEWAPSLAIVRLCTPWVMHRYSQQYNDGGL